MATDVTAVFSTHACHDCQRILQVWQLMQLFGQTSLLQLVLWATPVTVSTPLHKERD